MRHDRILASGTIIGDREAAAALLAPAFAGLRHEELRILHLDDRFRLMRHAVARDGGETTIELPLRDLIRDALLLGSRALILAHNHPGGDPTPSRADKAATRRLCEIARPLDIRIIDHLVFAGAGWTSFHQLGLL